ncbi:molybdopterin-guanine dinucleotide biosynthesis protein B [Planctomicrobium sp.]|nr:molybdopterin-guanine dinucleotide biosynthesis protein B [Planctomicrobium sp.]MBT5020167.1 molybdopterin-guanine dinucleotide biosynthesis protein B [Planctomicrobium sp.]MDA7503431.1 molybdopterin-guanine dinucleotide biosynthesis protein B [bacterium]MDB4743973.1 molybdopterin-guanine dinucleotide biosynthesis protein B [Planctomicrobium sp.]
MKKIHIVGNKNSGKTTLVVDLVREFSSRSLRVGTIKHTHHHHEFDVPGKDSFQHRDAGASMSCLIGPNMSAAFWDSKDTSDTHMEALFANCDFVLVEGDQHADAIKIEVWRKETGQPPLASKNPSIRYLITDDEGHTTELPVWSRSDIVSIASQILKVLDIEV